MRILVAGASGMIGSELRDRLEADRHTVLRLVRHDPRSESEFTWSPTARIIDFTLMERVDAVINLAGASLSHLPWTRRYKKQILDSRIHTTQTLADAMRMAATAPGVFINASAVGYYGDRPGERLTEKSSKGSGFLSDLVDAWESAARLAPEKTRVVTVRSGVVVGRGGAMRPLLPLARLGLSGPIGTGGQHWPWISLHDEVAAIIHLLDSSLEGPVNLVGPTPITADGFLRELAAQVHRPYGLPLPEKVVDVTLRDAGQELLLSSQKVIPEKLLADGFVFADAKARDAIARLVARRAR
ncbi:TIGR01777 family oxidoreductase [Diaminobutyricibacter sp. McL0608]|uniref:TIGR01777 family oxidoreductase n=1 Tax=Leifsonia sp. McL0608 TaxID=3143537 RepID=UPI0031F3009F